MPEVRSYSSIYNIDHRVAADIFDGPVAVQEKVDGSQFSFGVYDGEVAVRSKGQQIILDAPPKMFKKAVDTVLRLAPRLVPGWTYRGEYLEKPKHNALAYSRVPKDHIILYDIDRGHQDYLSPEETFAEGVRLGLEVVPLLYYGVLAGPAEARALLPEESILGGVKPEGVVVKNYAKLDPEKKTLMVKFVTEAFREVHKKAWGESNPGQKDIIQRLIETYKVEARWEKAVQHLRDADVLTGTVKDIGALIKEVPRDVRKEEEDAIKDALFAYAWPHILRGITSGLPQWYKARLEAEAMEAAA